MGIPGWDSHPACEVWERLENMSLSYINLVPCGETLKFTAAFDKNWQFSKHPKTKDQLLKPVLDKFEVAWVSHLETVAQSEAQRLKRDISSVPTRWCRHYFKILQLKCVQGQSFITSEKFGPGLELRPWPKLLNSIILSEYLSHCLWTEMLHNFLKCNFPGLWPQRFIFILKIILT